MTNAGIYLSSKKFQEIINKFGRGTKFWRGRRPADKPDENDAKFLGGRRLTKGRPTSQKGAIQNFLEEGGWPTS